MVTDRLMQMSLEGENPTFDENLLGISLVEDEHHFETPVSFFKQAGTMTKIYEDEQGPIAFCRVSKSLRIDVHFLDNLDTKRNASAMYNGFNQLVANAKENGFMELCFQTNSPTLSAFCIKHFGFEVSNGELRRAL